SVAVVGTRAISPYGTQATRKVVADLAKHQWTIVSGGALGVDTVAHSAALEMHTPTIAVAACGIDYDYPARNAPLFHRIAQTGTVVSEFAPGTTPQRHRFLSRNRLVAAMPAGTVVVEAAFRSGALTPSTGRKHSAKSPWPFPGRLPPRARWAVTSASKKIVRNWSPVGKRYVSSSERLAKQIPARSMN